jgi:hypothetical protein
MHDTKPAAENGMIGKKPLTDPMLKKIRDEVEKSVPAELKDGYLRIVVAGMKLIFSEQTNKMALNALTRAAAKVGPYRATALGVVTLIGIIYRESKGKMSIPAAFPASIVLLCYALEFLEKTTNLQVNEQNVAQMTKIVTLGVMKLFNITKENLVEGAKYNLQQKGKAGTPGQTPVAGAGGSPATPVPTGV